MPLSSGARLGSYEILSPIGEGGMGQVWRARDTRLDREVAVKVLPDALATDGERLARLRREAHLLASLNHPHIAAIYGLEEADGKPFLVLELVEGEDLSQRLARGPIPIDEAIDIAEQVAEALEDAHNRGIVHRDLKPANVKRSSDGRVKVLDFGLAKAFAGEAVNGESSGPIVSQSPTVAYTGTMAGVILGTAAYMSPEQARGRPVDKRTDVWAFGVLLWEMLTGRAMFAGETVTDILAAVVTRESDLGAVPAGTPAAVRRLLTRCLRKDPRQRLPDIGSARLELQELRAGAPETSTAAGAPSVGQGMRRRERMSWAAVCVIAAGVAAALAQVHFREAPAPLPAAARFTIDPPAEWDFVTDFSWPAISPDGRQIVFSAAPARRDSATQSSMLWVRPLESLAAHPLAGTEGASNQAWSPDGKSLLFSADKEVRRFNVADGTVQRICAIPGTGGESGIDSNDSGTILFGSGGGNGQIYSVPATGGNPKPIMPVDRARGDFQFMPRFLPDGRRFLFTLNGEESGVYVASLLAPADRRRISERVRSIYDSGHLLFVRDGMLLAQVFDVAAATSSGEPVAIASSVASWAANDGVSWFSASAGGTLAYFSGPRAGTPFQLAWVDRKGALINKVGDAGNFGQLMLSPDSRNVALEIPDGKGQYDLWVMDLARGVLSRVTATPDSNERDPVWSPDGLSVIFSVSSEKGDSLRRKGLRATDPESVIDPGFAERAVPEFWTPDGETILVIRRYEEKDEQPSVWALPLKGGKGAQVASGVHIDEPQVSPDGRWLAYVSRESGQDEVYVEPFRRQGAQVRVSTSGGGQPKWRADGKELFYASSSDRLMAVAVRSSADRVDVSLPSELFQLHGIEGSVEDDYAPGPDGQRFLVKLPQQQGAKPQLQVVTNWTSLLR